MSSEINDTALIAALEERKDYILSNLEYVAPI